MLSVVYIIAFTENPLFRLNRHLRKQLNPRRPRGKVMYSLTIENNQGPLHQYLKLEWVLRREGLMSPFPKYLTKSLVLNQVWGWEEEAARWVATTTKSCTRQTHQAQPPLAFQTHTGNLDMKLRLIYSGLDLNIYRNGLINNKPLIYFQRSTIKWGHQYPIQPEYDKWSSHW